LPCAARFAARGGRAEGLPDGQKWRACRVMKMIWRAVDRSILIGTDIQVFPTDIDPRGARVMAKGRMLGGPEDGATFQQAYELSKGQSFAIGPMIVVTLVDVRDGEAQLGVQRPAHINVLRKETYERLKGEGKDQ
jgi:sRNA-binding carbon storage regulator CsrA